MELDSLIFGGSAFLAGLALLQYGADAFIDNTAIVARRIGVSETLIALLTAGAEWEELAIVIASTIQHQPSLGLGNVLGSCIGNILGAFSLGLLACNGVMKFDRTAKIYAGAQFVVTSMFALLAYEELLNLTGGILFLVSFFVYLFSVLEGIYEGFMDPPEEIEEDEEGEEPAGVQGLDEEISAGTAPTRADQHAELHIAIYPSIMHCHPTERTALLHVPPPLPSCTSPLPLTTPPQRRRSTTYHTIKLLLGLTSTTISGFILSRSAIALASTLNLSSTVIGLTILSFATTLPEKVISVLSGLRGRPGILVASTAGCNIFLLTLCLGVIFVAEGEGTESRSMSWVREGSEKGDGEIAKGILPFEIWCCWGSSVLLMAVTWLDGRPWIGGLMLGLYGGFLGCEFTVYKR